MSKPFHARPHGRESRTPVARAEWRAWEPFPMPAAPLGKYRSAGLRTLELNAWGVRCIAFPSFAAQWQLMRLGSITVAGAVLESPCGSPASRNLSAGRTLARFAAN